MPDLTLSFTNPHILDDVSFHPCVRYNRYEQSRVISFVPPDGAFKLMNYRYVYLDKISSLKYHSLFDRVKGQLQLPIYVKPQISFNTNGGRVNVMVGMKNIQAKVVEEVVITIQFPKSISSTTLTANIGTVNYDDLTKV